MNVLIVSENFLDGGLETQINSTVQSLEGKINFFFAIKNYNNKWNLKNLYTGFNFSYFSTINQFCDDVEKLIAIIKDNNIDVIHVHPFFSFFPAVFAAKLCKKPIIYTYHGISSYNFTCELNDTILFNMFLDYEVDKIFSVSLEGKKIFDNIIFETDKIIYLPNSINTRKFCTTKICENKSWALISRLEEDKINEIEKLLKILDTLDIQELHVFGDGSQRLFLEQYISKNNLTNKVFLEGHCDNLPEKLSGKFNGIIGIGRVVMESISMEFPTILIGFNKISGLIDTNIYNYIKDKNFTNKFLPEISPNTLKTQIQQVYNNTYDKNIYKIFKENFSTEVLSEKYYNELKNINYSSILNLEKLYNEIKTLNSDDTFYNSSHIYNIFKKYFSFFIRQPHQKNLFIMGDNLLLQKDFNNKLNNKFNSDFNNTNNLINNKFTELENKINEFSEHTMTYQNFKRKLKYKFNKK